MWEEFKKFAIKGNVIDLAVAVVIGTAFGKIVTSLVEDIIMPLTGILLGGYSTANLSYSFGNAVLRYGAFLQSIIDFFIISFSIFMVIRLIAKFKNKEEEVPVEQEVILDRKEELLTEIRDLLAKEKPGK